MEDLKTLFAYFKEHKKRCHRDPHGNSHRGRIGGVNANLKL